MPFLFAVSGFKDSGKTTLCWKLVSILKNKGLDVAYLKHTHEAVLSSESTDTGRDNDVNIPRALWGPDGLILEFPHQDLMKENVLSLAFRGKDIVLLEGGKYLGCPKIWVGPVSGIPEGVPGVLACYSNPETPSDFRSFQPGSEDDIASFIYGLWEKAEEGKIELYIGDKRIPVKTFVSDFLARGLQGMLGALHGVCSFAPGISVFIKKEKRSRTISESSEV